MGELKQALDLCIADLKTVEKKDSFDRNIKASGPISLWVPQEYKDKYDDLQASTNRQFGKVLQEMIKRAIDSVS